MKVKLYNRVKELLTENPELRDSDKKLIWEVWQALGLTEGGYYMNYRKYLESPSTESIRRCRQKIQEKHPELRGSEKIRKARTQKQSTKGTWVYREEIKEQTTLL